MKFKIGLIFLLVIIVIVAIFVFQNSVEVPIVLYPGNTLHFPLSIVVISSIILGIILMFLFFIGIEMKLRMQNRKVKKELDKKEKSIELLKKGFLNFIKGNIKDAKKELLNSYKIDEKNISPLIILKEIDLDAIDKFPSEIRKYLIIDYFYKKGQFENIADIGDELINDNNFKNVELLEIIKKSYLKLKNFDKAVEVQNKISKIIKNGKDELIKLNFLKAKNSKNIDELKNFIKKNPKVIPAYIEKFNITNEVDSLIEGYKKTLNNIFLYLIAKNFNLEEAENYLQKCGKDENVKIFLAITYAKNNKTDEALNLLNTINNNSTVKILKCFIEKNNLNFENLYEIYCENCKKSSKEIFDICNNCNAFNTVNFKWKV